ncbi:MAG: thiosulfohydrolase SoxB, partial [Gammaproteobacteria bacterium]
MTRRDFLQALLLSAVTPGCSLFGRALSHDGYYDGLSFGNAALLHFTDCHAQLLPMYYREPAANIGVGLEKGKLPHLTGKTLLDYYGILPGSREAYALTHADFSELAAVYGKMGGFAYLTTLIKRLKELRGNDNCLLLDGGDTWQGSATALWCRGGDMVDVANRLGVDVMTGHWEFTYGSGRVLENLKRFNGCFVAQNVSLSEEAQFESEAVGDAVFKPYIIKELMQARIAVIGQAFPYTPIANPRRFVPDWQFGIQERNLQTLIDRIRAAKSADVVVLLSHNGMDVDLKLASKVSGLDFILGGHTHDAVPAAIPVDNAGGKTWVTNAGSHGKFLAVLDMDVRNRRVRDFRYRLLPVFSNLLKPDSAMLELIERIRAPFQQKLQRPLVIVDELLYRRDNFGGTFDRLILDALLKINAAEIALSPGFRWGPSFLPRHVLTFEDVMSHTAITYPETYVRTMSGRSLKILLEDVADNLFNKDPYLRQGGDMVRVGGMRFSCQPEAPSGRRITNLTLTDGTRLSPHKQYKVTGWAGTG